MKLIALFLFVTILSSTSSHAARRREVAVKEHHRLSGDDLKEVEASTEKAHEDVTTAEQDAEEVKSKVIGEVAAARNKHPLPKTSGEKSALKQEVVKEEKKLLKKAENEAKDAVEKLEPLESAVKKGNIDLMDAAKKLGESDAAIQEAGAVASVGTSMEKKLASDTATTGNST